MLGVGPLSHVTLQLLLHLTDLVFDNARIPLAVLANYAIRFAALHVF